MDASLIHKNIINFLNEKGPSLPINISKSLGINSLFTSAFLSELANQNIIKVSNLKVGGSPLYYMEGQQKRLEDYYKYLHPREAEAYILLKQYKVLKDNDQDPVVRVALRSIRDFSQGFKLGEDIYWKFFLASQEEVNEVLNGGKESEKKSEEKTEEYIDKKIIDEKIAKNNLKVTSKKLTPEKSENQFYNPLVIKEEKKKKDKPKSDFVQRVINFLDSKGIKIIEEKSHKSKDYTCIVQIKSELGPVNFFTQAKDKKIITLDDLKKLLSDAQSIPLPAFMIYTGEIANKAKEYINNYGSILKAKKII